MELEFPTDDSEGLRSKGGPEKAPLLGATKPVEQISVKTTGNNVFECERCKKTWTK